MMNQKALSLPLLLCGAFALVLGSFAADAPVKDFGRNTATTQSKAEAPGKKPGDEPPEPLSIPELVQRLTPRERIAQLMLVTLLGKNAPDTDDMQYLIHNTPGGVIIPATLRPSAAASYVTTLRQIPFERQRGIPLFVATNLYTLEQPGRTAFFSQLPSLLSIAAANDPDITERLGTFIAEYLNIMGFNMHLGPTLELAPTLPDAKGSLQSLGSNPEFAATAGAAIVHSLSEHGIVAVPTGFPGGGMNHLPKQPAVLMTPKASLAKNDVLPYARAIAGGAQMIHVANTRVPTLELDKRPASLSKAVMRDLLRDELKFEGVVLVGPLDSTDVTDLVDPLQAAVQSIASGADMILWNLTGPRVVKAIDKIGLAVESGFITQETIDAACARVLTLKEKMGLRGRPISKPGAAEKIEKDKSYPKEAYEIERRAVTLVKNTGNVLPLSKGASMPIGVTGTVGVEAFKNALEKHIKPISMQPIETAKYVGNIESFEIDRIVRTVSGIRTTICIFTETAKTRGQTDLVRALKAKGTRVVVVLLGYPSALPELTDADAIVVAYCEGSLVNESLKAVAEALVGEGALGVFPEGGDVPAKAGQAVKLNAFSFVRSPAGILPVTIDSPFVAGFNIPCIAPKAFEKVEWDFGDDTKGAKGVEVQHTYATAGAFEATVSVRDKKGEFTERTFKVAVE
jgi:beta-N-acetylhexosaminidase